MLKTEKKQRKEWVKGWLANRQRKGAYTNIIRELKLIDKENYRRYLRMDEETFKVILFNFLLDFRAYQLLYKLNTDI